MSNSKFKRVLDIQIETEKSVKNLRNLEQRIDSLFQIAKATHEQLIAFGKMNGVDPKVLNLFSQQTVIIQKTAVARRKLTEEEKLANRIATLRQRAANAERGSLKQLEAQLALNRIAVDKMSASERRNTAEGIMRTETLRKQADELRKLRKAQGDYKANIGNYPTGGFGGLGGWQGKAFQALSPLYTVRRVYDALLGPYQKFESQMSAVRAISGATGEEFRSLENDARRLGKATEYTAMQVAELQTIYAQAGFKPREIIDATEATLDLATATGVDLANAADFAGMTLKAFGLNAKEMPRVIDVTTEALNRSMLKLDMFANAMSYVAPIARQTNVSLEECAALIGVLADQGVRGSRAGTGLRRIFSELAADSRPLNERLAELNKTGITVTEAMDEVGRHAMTAMTIIGNGVSEVEALTEALRESEGAAKAAADIRRDNIAGDMKLALSATQEYTIWMGNKLSPLIRWFIQAYTSFAGTLKEWTQAIKWGAGAVVSYNAVLKIWHGWTRKKRISLIADTAATRMNTAATEQNRIAMLRQVVALRYCTKGTQLLAAGKLILAGNARGAQMVLGSLFKTVMGHPLGMLAVGLASAVTYFVFFRKRASEAQKAQKDFNDEVERYNKEQEEKRQRIEALIGVIRDEGETDLAKKLAYEELRSLSKALTDQYTQEELATLSLTKQNKLLNEERDTDSLAHWTKQAQEHEEEIRRSKEHLKHYYETIRHNGGNAIGAHNAAENEREKIRYLEGQLRFAEEKIAEIRRAEAALEREAAEKADPAGALAKAVENRDRLRAEFQGYRDMLLQEKGKIEELGPVQIEFVNNLPSVKKLLSEYEFAQREVDRLEELNNKSEGSSQSTQSFKVSLARKSSEELERIAAESEDKEEKRIASQILKVRRAEQKRIEARKKAEEERLKVTQGAADMALKFANEQIDAEIATMKEGAEKKLRTQEQAAKKAEDAAAKEYRNEIQKIDKTLAETKKYYGENSEGYKALEKQKTDLAAAYEARRTAIAKSNAQARKRIMAEASDEELQELAKVPGYHSQAILALFDNTRKASQQSIKTAREATEQSIAQAQRQHDAQKTIIAQTVADEKKRKEALKKNELELLETKAKAYEAELEMLHSLGMVDTERYANLLDALRNVKTQAEKIADSLGSDKKGKKKGFLAKMLGVEKEEADAIAKQALELANTIGNSIITAAQNASQRRLENEKKAIQSEYDIYTKLLDDKRDKGLISEKRYQAELEKLEAEKLAKEEQAERDAFERDKRLRISKIWMDYANGMIAIWSTSFGIVTRGILSAILTAQATAQAAFIANEKYAQGGIIPIGEKMGVITGRSHEQGGHRIYLDGIPVGEVEADELIAIVNKRDTRRIGALSAINAVHGRRFAAGGIIHGNFPTPAPLPSVRYARREQEYFEERSERARQQTAAQIDAINRRIDRLQVVVMESDITKAQKNVKKAQTLSSF